MTKPLNKTIRQCEQMVIEAGDPRENGGQTVIFIVCVGDRFTLRHNGHDHQDADRLRALLNALLIELF